MHQISSMDDAGDRGVLNGPPKSVPFSEQERRMGEENGKGEFFHCAIAPVNREGPEYQNFFLAANL